MEHDPMRGAAPGTNRGGRSEHHQGDDDGDSLAAIFGPVKGRRRAGPPPPKPYISPEARAIGSAYYDLDRRQRIEEQSRQLRHVLIGGVDSLWFDIDPVKVARRVAAACTAFVESRSGTATTYLYAVPDVSEPEAVAS